MRSEPGAGATFEVLLPRVDPITAPAGAEAQIPAPSDDDQEAWTILLVEDDPAILRLARTSIESAGHRVLSATSGEEALKIAADHPNSIDLLVTDVVMPGMTGIELADALAGESPEIGLIYISGYQEPSLSDLRLPPRRALYLAKPFSAERLLETIRLARRRRAAPVRGR